MAHSITCRCRAVINRRSLRLNLQLFSWTGISRDMNFGHWRFSASVPCVWKPTWMYSDEMFYLYCTSCKPGFSFKCFKFRLCWRSLYLSLLCDKRYLERNESVRQTEGTLRTMTDRVPHLSAFMFTVKNSPLHTSTTCWTLWTPTPLSISLSFSPSIFFPSLYGCQTMLSSEGWTWTAALALCSVRRHCQAPRPLSGRSHRQRWNRLPALSALKCSLTSHPDCEKLI